MAKQDDNKKSTAVMVLDRLPESRLPVAPAMLEKMQVWLPDGSEKRMTAEDWQVLTDQTSIEAYVTPRWEFMKLQADSNAPTWLYATARVGFACGKGRSAFSVAVR